MAWNRRKARQTEADEEDNGPPPAEDEDDEECAARPPAGMSSLELMVWKRKHGASTAITATPPPEHDKDVPPAGLSKARPRP